MGPVDAHPFHHDEGYRLSCDGVREHAGSMERRSRGARGRRPFPSRLHGGETAPATREPGGGGGRTGSGKVRSDGHADRGLEPRRGGHRRRRRCRTRGQGTCKRYHRVPPDHGGERRFRSSEDRSRHSSAECDEGAGPGTGGSAEDGGGRGRGSSNPPRLPLSQSGETGRYADGAARGRGVDGRNDGPRTRR